MARILDTTHISAEIDSLLDSAELYVIIICPYLDIPERIISKLVHLDRNGTTVLIVFGKEKKQKIKLDWVEKTGILLKFLENLHAKCYINESRAILTSLNLYEYSQINNYEIGILISEKKDRALYYEIENRANEMISASDYDENVLHRVSSLSKSESYYKSIPAQSIYLPRFINLAFGYIPNLWNRYFPDLNRDGSCISCGEANDLDPDYPYCVDCYGKWAKLGKNRQQVEQYCHECGEEYPTYINQPFCWKCRKGWFYN